MLPDSVKTLFLNKYSTIGYEKFYKFLLVYAIDKIISIDEQKVSPEIELLEYNEKFIQMYRREGNEVYLEIARQFRRAAHKIYKIMLNKKLIEKNNKFLNMV